MEEAPTADKDTICIENPQKFREDNFKLAIDYYSKDNPFKKVIIVSTIGVVGSYSAAIVALGMSGAYISGGILFYDTAFLVGGYATLAGVAGLVVGIPAVLGGIGYAIYKAVKTKKVKDFMNKLSDKDDQSVEEEREIFSLLTKECLEYFNNYIQNSFIKKAKDLIEKDTEYIIREIHNYDSKGDDYVLKEQIRKEIIDMNFINIILIGGTGVGKSTLINEFLQLKDNKAKEGETADPQKIEEGWPKKYPVFQSDTDIKGINLYDTEGIEKKGENDFKNHLDKIVEFIHSPDLNLKEKINAIWYCINSNRLDHDEEYIQKIFDMFSNLKIPIIFIFTKAFANRELDIEMIYNGLQNFKYYKENPNELHFIEIIAKDVVSKRTGKILESKKGLDELLQETKNISKNTILAPIIKKISDIFNKNSQEIIGKLSAKLQDQYNDFISKHDKFKTFNEKLLDIFETIYGPLSDKIKDYIKTKIKSWMTKLEEIRKNDLKAAIKNYDNKYLMNKIENIVKNKYDEKIKKNENLPENKQFKLSYKEFKENIEDYLITQINSSKDIYGLYTLFDMARDSVLGPILKDLEIELNKKKLNMTKDLEVTIFKKIEEFVNKLKE